MLDILFLAAPIAFKGRLVQYAKRILRPHPGKTTAEIHDYHDINTGVLAGQPHLVILAAAQTGSCWNIRNMPEVDYFRCFSLNGYFIDGPRTDDARLRADRVQPVGWVVTRWRVAPGAWTGPL